jgi:hypothetical protein
MQRYESGFELNKSLYTLLRRRGKEVHGDAVAMQVFECTTDLYSQKCLA